MENNFEEIVKQIENELIPYLEAYEIEKCFKPASNNDLEYLNSLNLPDEILSFYTNNNPQEEFEINGIRLLPIESMKTENTMAIPGYVLSPLGYSAIASTNHGDVYFIKIMFTLITNIRIKHFGSIT